MKVKRLRFRIRSKCASVQDQMDLDQRKMELKLMSPLSRSTKESLLSIIATTRRRRMKL